MPWDLLGFFALSVPALAIWVHDLDGWPWAILAGLLAGCAIMCLELGEPKEPKAGVA